MTINECKKRKRELKQMLESIDTLKLAILRSIAIEDLNIAEIKKQGEYDKCQDCKYARPHNAEKIECTKKRTKYKSCLKTARYKACKQFERGETNE